MLTKKEVHWFNLAREEMLKSTFTRIHIGCIIVKGNKVLARGFNIEKSHPKQKHLNKRFRKFTTQHAYIHSELNAVLHSQTRDLEGATCYIYREDNHGNLACCKPCPACEFLLRQVGIATVYYTDTNKFIKEDYL